MEGHQLRMRDKATLLIIIRESVASIAKKLATLQRIAHRKNYVSAATSLVMIRKIALQTLSCCARESVKSVRKNHVGAPIFCAKIQTLNLNHLHLAILIPKQIL